MGNLHLDTTPIGGDGRYTITLSPAWNIWGPNGGYLAAIVLRAAGMESQIGRPASIACHFLSVARFEPVDIDVRTIQRGRRSESFHVTMSQGERAILHGIVRTAAESEGLEHKHADMPLVPLPEGLLSFEDLFPGGGRWYPFWDNIEGRPPFPDQLPPTPTPSEPIDVNWRRFRPVPCFDDPFTDAARSLILIDTISWPAASQPHRPVEKYMAPNLDVTAWFHDCAPDSEWLLNETVSDVATGGLMATSTRVWSRDGRLLASGGAQLMCVPAPPPQGT